ncbi:U3 snoRNP protein [Orbilia brochopaga]|uniref:U3 snoRNP protein n=1 Tax=Orbilia brochopaga TaxID=3140254 RepID=A0AAV9UDP7_9PEZI
MGAAKIAKSARKGGTASEKRHTFQTFTQRIASIKIDPVRRIRRFDDAPPSENSSFFFESLTAYNDLYLSSNFVDFSRATNEYAESLPHILYHQELIVTNIENAILKSDNEGEDSSLQPLLGLIPQLARDLGVEFEKYFERCVRLITGVVVRTKNVDVIEWGFDALACLLKHLSRLLVEDLRPLYTIIAPLLGKENQKHYIIRFMAEAMSFLVRKLRGDGLNQFVQTLARDLAQTSRASTRLGLEPFMDGLRLHLVNACMGIHYHLHSCVDHIIDALLAESLDEELGEEGAVWGEVVIGTVIGLIHKTKREKAEPLLKSVYQFVDSSADSGTGLKLAADLLFAVVGTRKGDRISDWERPAGLSLRLIQTAAKLGDDDCYWRTLQGFAIILQGPDVRVIYSRFLDVAASVSKYKDGALFLSYSMLLAESGLGRFNDFWLQHMVSFVWRGDWTKHEHEILIVLPKLEGIYKNQGTSWNPKVIPKWIPGSALQLVEKAFSDVNSHWKSDGDDMETDAPEHSLLKLYGYLQILESSHEKGEDYSSLIAPMKTTFSILRNVPAERRSHRVLAVMGTLLTLLADLDDENEFWDAVCDSLSELASEHSFLLGIKKGLEKERILLPAQNSSEFETIVGTLERNLESPSHDLRSVSLDILFLIWTSKSPEESETIKMMQMIESIPISFSTARNIGMHVRKLGLSYQAGNCGMLGERLLPHLCFGLLTIKFAPLWNDIIATLAKVAEKNEDVVSSLAFSWLMSSNSSDDCNESSEVEDRPQHVSEFQCLNLESLQKLATKTLAASADPIDVLRVKIDALKDPNLVQSTARGQALRLLYEIPQVAEKRSRQLVPLFLEWAQQQTGNTTDEDEDLAQTRTKWSGGDQTAMLKLFARFINPRVLYKAEEVYDALLDMLASGDTKRQTLALDCIFTWKSPAIRPYEDNLNNLCDSNFRDEITNFIQVDRDESTIQDNHRSQLMPVLLRILYGRCLSRKNAASGSRGMESQRISILASLANFNESDIAMFADIAMREFNGLGFVNKTDANRYTLNINALEHLKVSHRKQLGFVNMIEDMVKELGKSLGHIVEPIFDNLMVCIVNASRRLSGQADSEFETENLTIKTDRMIRQVGFRCINDLFDKFPDMPWARYMPAFFNTIVEPRLAKFAAEHAQSRSGLLNVFVTWSAHQNMSSFLVGYNDVVLRRVSECLGIPSVSDEVVLDITSLVQNLVARVEEDQTNALRKSLLAPYVNSFLHSFGDILEKSLPKETLEKCVEAVSQLAAYADGTAETKKLLQISLFLLSQPTKRVKPKAKSDILRIILHVLPGLLEEVDDDLVKEAFRITTSQFSFFRDRETRELLAKVLYVFVEWDYSLEEIARFCEDMNAYSMKNLDEPDFGKRLTAFAEINEDRYQVLTLKQWTPVVHNMLFFIKDQEELTTRANASYSLRRFVERAGKASTSDDGSAFAETLSTVLLPAIKNGIREESELIRMEYINVMGHIVKECDECELADMKPLLASGDEEANFFYNILHIQQHRRGRAIRRLADTVKKTPIGSSSLAHYLIPLIEHFIFDQDEGAHNLATDAINTLSVLAANIEWSQYKALFKRYLAQMKENPGEEKLPTRVISGMAEGLLQAKEKSTPAPTSVNGDIAMGGTEDHIPALAASLPPAEKLEDDVLKQMLPYLLIFLKQKDESTVSLRVPVAVAVTKLMKVLSDEAISTHLPPVLTSLCHILKSRDQTSRDLTRNTLSEITGLLGPKYFGFVLKELRGALTRGYQLHVLSFTVHAILVSNVPKWAVGSLDYCASNIMDVVMDDIFGVTASEKEVEGYTKKMKEIKTNKSYDSADILASITTLPYMKDVINPIRAILYEKLSLSLVKKVNELFRRIDLGLVKNPSASGRGILVFCWELVEMGYKASEPTEQAKGDSVRNELVVGSARKSDSGKSRKSDAGKKTYGFKLLRFALETVRAVIKMHDELMTPENMDAWVKVIGDGLESAESEIKISCIRLLTAIMKLPLPQLEKNLFIIFRDCFRILDDSPTTNSELAQATLKLMGSIIKDWPIIQIKPTKMARVLSKIRPDLEEPDRQGLTFNFLRVLLSRKVSVPEIFEIIDDVSKMMIQNHSKSVRESCRGLYYQFLTEYPHTQEKFNQQLGFLSDNLTYEHQTGRESVLEVIGRLLEKLDDDLVQSLVGWFCEPLASVLLSDEAEKCRDMAFLSLKMLFKRANETMITAYRRDLKLSLKKDQSDGWRRVGFRMWCAYVDSCRKDARNDLAFITAKIVEVAKESMADEAESLEGEDKMEIGWEQVYSALLLGRKLAELFPEEVKSARYPDLWKAIRACEGFPHPKVKLIAAEVTREFFGEFEDSILSTLPLRSARGLELTSDDLYATAENCSEMLLSQGLTEDLAAAAVRNLVFVARCFEATNLLRPGAAKSAHVYNADKTDLGAEQGTEEWDEWEGIQDDGDMEQEIDGPESRDAEQEQDADEPESADEELEQDQKHTGDNSSALAWLIHRANGIVRNDEMIQRKNVIGKKFALQWIGVMAHDMSVENLTNFAVEIIMPIYTMLETENEALKDLKPIASEVLQYLAGKMGVTAYSKAYATVRSKVMERRRVRKHKRSIQLVTDPERAAKKKARKHERSKESRKEKNKVFRDTRKAKYL